MAVFYRNPCYSEVFYNEVELHVYILELNRTKHRKELQNLKQISLVMRKTCFFMRKQRCRSAGG